LQKVTIIGIDGGTWTLLEPWIGAGRLPNLASIVREGVSAKMESVIPPVTPPAWTTAFTGAFPGKHNIFSFHTFRDEQRVTTSADRRVPALWQMASSRGAKTIVLNVPYTYPPDPINGIMVSGMGSPSLDNVVTYPEAFRDELVRRDYQIDEVGASPYRIVEMTRKHRELASHLLDHSAWDLFVVVFIGSDRLQHLYWKYLDPSHPDYDSRLRKQYEDIFLALYGHIDAFAGKALAHSDYVFVISDHGFGPITKAVSMTKFLQDVGLQRPYHGLERVVKVELEGRMMDARFRVSRRLPPALVPIAKRTWRRFVAHQREAAVQSTSPVGLFGQYWMCLNRGGKEGGTDGPAYQAERDEVISKLALLRDPESGARILTKIYRREEAYHGPYAKNGPDILFETLEGFSLKRKLTTRLLTHPVGWSGEHRKYGIFMGRGPDLKAGSKLEPLSISDFLPTVLHLLAWQIPRYCDGKVATAVFKEDSRAGSTPPAYFDSERQRAIERVAAMKKRSVI